MITKKIRLPSDSSIKDLCKKINKDLGVIALDWYKKGFNYGGGKTDAGKWAPRKHEYSNDLLIKTGRLRASIRISKITDKGIHIRASTKERGADKEYSGYINQGTKKMVARQFLGYSSKLNAKLEKEIIKQTLSYFKTFKKV